MAVRIESQAEPLPGYRLLERLGGGGFGEVWKCEAPGGLLKAIKFVHGDLSAAGEDGQRAEQELKALSRVKTVRHPYILSLERFDILDGQLMIVMELADRNLWDRFKECRARGLPGIPREELLGYLVEIAEALDLMNIEYQLQHLDIKPQNLFLVHNHIKVADFGLVKDLEGMRTSMTGGVTPVYAAPETFDGWVSRYCDQYSLAIVYQELLTGQRPFRGNNVRQLILQHMQAPPHVEPLPPHDRPAIARALSKTPGERFPSCRDLVAALKNGDAGTMSVRSPSLAQETDASRSTSIPSVSPTEKETERGCEASAIAELMTARLRPQKEESRRTKEAPRSTEEICLSPFRPPPFKAPPEINGNGVLFPALVIGLGHLGMAVVQQLRQELHVRLGGLERLPHLRLMGLDTDPEAIRAATRGCGGAGISPILAGPGDAGVSPVEGARLNESDVLLVPLNRPSYYLKPRDGRPEVGSWLPTRMLYRIPRSQVTAGVRALGRLAFCDNYRLIVQRLQTELNICMDPETLNAAVKQTGLGLRSNRVRVYVIAGLAGGTGGGMFLDLAYTVRALLKQAGYPQPDVVGLFLLPSVDRNRTRTLTLGNTYAALNELRYFARRGTRFTAQYYQREPALEDDEPPFTRSVCLSLPDETDEWATRQTIEQAGLFLACDLCSPLGLVADLGRAELNCIPWEARGLFYQTFAFFQVAWPRRELLAMLARRLCHRLVQRWISKDSKPIREAVRVWVEEQWAQQQLGSSLLMERLGEMTQQVFGQDSEEIFRRIAELQDGPFLPEQLAKILDQLEELLGKPQDDGLSDTPARLVVALREAADKLVQQWEQKLAELPVRLIETPEFRLAGAEEALRQMVASIEQTLQNHEPLARELSNRAAELYDRLHQLLDSSASLAGASTRRSGVVSVVFRKSSSGSRKHSAHAEVQELLRDYSKTLYQGLLLRQAGNIFLTLRGHLADEMREINFCRLRLGELLHALEAPVEAAPAPSAAVKYFYPGGCKDLKETLQYLESQLKEDALKELDVRMQEMLHKQFTALVNVCLGTDNVLKNVEAAMRQTAEAFAAERLGEVNVTEMFLQQHPDDAQAAAALADFFDKAAPKLPSPIVPPLQGEGAAQLCVLAAPAGPAGEHLQALAAQALPDVEWQAASSAEDILLYRERVNLPLSELPQLGPLAQDAYRQMNNAEHFTPHCRCDVDFNVPE
jgi:serine/threonine protein kinase